MFLIATVLGIVEGLTEFVPVSSTGHLILAGHLLGFTGARADSFEIFIQLGAILAVIGLFPSRFRAMVSKGGTGFTGMRAIGLLLLTSLPGLMLGKLAHHAIKAHLFNPLMVAMGLFLGACLMIAAEYFQSRNKRERLATVDGLDWKQALGIGCFQCLALWPGMSRSSSTMVGGMLLGLNRATAAEYSFLAAVPIITAATLYDLYKNWHLLALGDLGYFAWGFAVSFFFAWISMRFLLRFLTSHSLNSFAVYRIAAALAIFMLWK